MKIKTAFLHIEFEGAAFFVQGMYRIVEVTRMLEEYHNETDEKQKEFLGLTLIEKSKEKQ